MTRYWIAVASKEHVSIGKKLGIMQVCHGKQAPLKKMKSGDWVIYYSPVEIYGEKMPCRKFTAIGKITNKEPYQFKMNETFIPWRRDVEYISSEDILIEPFIDKLSFIKNKKNWGYVFRFGLVEIPLEDFRMIGKAMGVFCD
jgi:predicted RNA-binding protein